MYEYLKQTGQYEKLKRFKELWGENTEWTTRSALAPDDGPEHDLLEEHIALIAKAILLGML